MFNIIPTALAEITQVIPKTTDPKDYVLAIINKVQILIFSVVGVLAVIFIVWAGWDFLTSGGDEKKVTAAKNKLIYAMVAIGVIALAAAIPAFVSTFIQA